MINRLPDLLYPQCPESYPEKGGEEVMELTLLLVEDEPLILKRLEAILKPRVKCVISVTSGEDALIAYRNERVDVVLSDLILPGMSGIELIDHLGDEKECYTIVMTGYDDASVLEELIKRRITFFMHKPLDITVKSQKELRIKEEMIRRQSVQASMGEMLSVIAHQWKQPLGIINAILADLQLDAIMSEKESLWLDRFGQIEKETDFLSNTVELFTNLFNPNKSSSIFYVGELIEEAVALYSHLIESKNIAISVDNRALSPFRGYPDELFHVLLIFLTNAIEAFDPEQNEKSLLIHAFEDNAGGVEAGAREKMFEPYFTTKPPGTGNGLGLYVAKMIIEGRGWGEIEFKEIEGGSRFGVCLSQQGGCDA